MKKAVLAALIAVMALPAAADNSNRSGRKLDAIASGRLYDRILTPQLNPNYIFDNRAEREFLYDVQRGRADWNTVPEGRRSYFEFKLNELE